MTFRSLSASPISRAAVVTTMLAGVGCAPRGSQAPSVATQGATAQETWTPVLLSCPAGQQPLLRQVVVNGAAVPQVECVSATAVGMASGPAMPTTGVPDAYAAPSTPTPFHAAAPVAYETAAPVASSPRQASGPQARRVVYEDDIVEYKRPAKRSWKKSALIIGGAAGAGAGVGAATGGKKGALIGAAVGGGAATVWDQVTRRQSR